MREEDDLFMDIAAPQLSRQQFMCGLCAGGAAVALTACSSYSEPSAQSGTTDTASPPSTDAQAAPAVLAPTADVPVGGGVIVDDLVLTQPTAGDFKGFSNVCTHSGCRVNEVSDGAIICPCHGSRFNLDGTVAEGPATQPLESKVIAVEGESIVAG